MNFFGICGFELIVIFGLAFFLLGPKKMIETSREAGKIIRDLKTERDKFTNMVMQEYEDDDEPDTSTPGKTTDPSPNIAPVGTVSRPRGRVQPVSTPSGETDQSSDTTPNDESSTVSEESV